MYSYIASIDLLLYYNVLFAIHIMLLIAPYVLYICVYYYCIIKYGGI